MEINFKGKTKKNLTMNDLKIGDWFRLKELNNDKVYTKLPEAKTFKCRSLYNDVYQEIYDGYNALCLSESEITLVFIDKEIPVIKCNVSMSVVDED